MIRLTSIRKSEQARAGGRAIQRLYFKFLLATSLMASLAACSSSASVGAAYQLPFIPVQFSISSSGQISVALTDSVVTPYGTFSVSADVAKTLRPSTGLYWLIIRHKRSGALVDSVYEIYTDQKIIVVLDGRTTIQFTNQSCFIDASSASASVRVQSGSMVEGNSANSGSVTPTVPINAVTSQPNPYTVIMAWQNTASNASYIQVCANIDLQSVCKNLPPTTTRYKFYSADGVDEDTVEVGACNKAGCSYAETIAEPPGISA
jgi:hypothetical protein